METVCRQGLLYSCEHSRVSWGFHCNSAATLVSGFYGMCFLPVACQSRLMRRAEMAVITFCSVLITIGLCIISLTISNSPFCPHRVLMCFVWIWEQTAIISLCNSNWLPPPPQETVCVYRAVRTGSLYIIRLMDFRVRSQTSPCQIMVDTVALWQLFLPVLQFPPVRIIPPVLQTHLHLQVDPTRRRKGRSLGTFREQCSFRNPAALDRRMLLL